MIRNFGDLVILTGFEIFNKVLGGSTAMLKISMIPAQRIKILLQTQALNIPGQNNPPGFSGVVQNLSESGWSSFWTGSLFAIIRYYIMGAAINLRQLSQRKNRGRRDNNRSGLDRPTLSPQLFPLLLILIMTPIDTLIARSMATSPSDANFSSWNLLRESFGSSQILSLFNGAPIGILMVFIYLQASKIIRGQLMRLLFESSALDQQKSNLISFAASIAAGILIFPMDTIRQNMMLSMAPFDMNPLPIATSLFMNGGVGALFAGCVVKFITLILAGALQVLGNKYINGHRARDAVVPTLNALTF